MSAPGERDRRTGPPAAVPEGADDGHTIRAAVIVCDHRGPARTGPEHYPVRSGADAYSPGLLPFATPELAGFLETGPDGGSDHAALTPVPSPYLPDTISYTTGRTTGEFVAALRGP